MPVFTESKIANLTVSADDFRGGAVTDAKISSLSTNRGAFVDNGLSVVAPIGKSLVTGGPARGLVFLTLAVGSQSSRVAAGNHVHGQDGYTSVGSTGVSSHTHPVSINASTPIFIENSPGTGTHGGHSTGNNGQHNHSRPATSGTTGSNTSTLKLKKEISDYEVSEIKNLLNLQLKRYKYKNQVRHLQESINRDWMYGYIAEEVENLGFEELVGYDEKGEPASLNYGLLSTLVLELVKVQQTEISLIKEKIKRRREKYDRLSS
jgi:hypothetical protein